MPHVPISEEYLVPGPIPMYIAIKPTGEQSLPSYFVEFLQNYAVFKAPGSGKDFWAHRTGSTFLKRVTQEERDVFDRTIQIGRNIVALVQGLGVERVGSRENTGPFNTIYGPIGIVASKLSGKEGTIKKQLEEMARDVSMNYNDFLQRINAGQNVVAFLQGGKRSGPKKRKTRKAKKTRKVPSTSKNRK